MGLQAALLAGLGAFVVAETLVATTTDVVRALVAAGLALASAAGLALVARGLLRRRRWARSPALVTNLIAVPVALGLVQGGRWYLGTPLAIWAVVVLVLLFLPSTDRELDG